MVELTSSASVRNSQALRDLSRAARDLEEARRRRADPLVLIELQAVADRARSRVRALEQRRVAAPGDQ
jgi:hypothetical protein